jgi:hypothetical protein
MQVVLAVITMAVMVLHEHLWLFWAASFAALAVVVVWPTIDDILRTWYKKREHYVTVPSPRERTQRDALHQSSILMDSNTPADGDSVFVRTSAERQPVSGMV